MVGRVVIGFIFICFVCSSVFSQDRDSLIVVQDSIINPIDSVAVPANDTVAWVDGKVPVDKQTELILKNVTPFKPNPNRAVLYSAIIPGLGQFYNKKYWKLPIVYGGVIGLVYALSWNGRHYGDYTDAYRAIMNENRYEAGYKEKWVHFLSVANQQKIEAGALTDGELRNFQERFRRQRDMFRRNRDLSIIGIVALYAISMIDAYVDAQLYDFDISPDLSFTVQPAVHTDAFSRKSFGIQCNIKF
ncbi:MAG: DUF5683 domain-containing protein [Dysgonomonas sp.]|nr:DUF5683 domain-containing protein [Dysgonomonas sp.]